jgi:hypothetical protein
MSAAKTAVETHAQARAEKTWEDMENSDQMRAPQGRA